MSTVTDVEAPEGLMETAPTAQWSDDPNVHDISTVAAPGSVLPAPSVLPLPATMFQRSVCPEPVVKPEGVSAATMPKTSSSVAELIHTLAVEDVSFAPSNGPRGVVWSTPVKVITPAIP